MDHKREHRTPPHKQGSREWVDKTSWGGRLFFRGDRRLDSFCYKIINSLAQVPFNGVLVEAYKSIEENTI